LRTLICRLLDIDMKNSWNLRVDMTSLSIIETYPEINMLCLFNDVSHLMAERNSWKKGVCPGLVPDNRMGRLYRDILGRANQMLAQTADEVFLLVAGIPMRVKPNETI